MRKKHILTALLALIMALLVPMSALADSQEYTDIAAGAKTYSTNVAKVFYENGTYTPDFWSAYAARMAYVLNEQEYKYLLPDESALALPEDITAPALADVILMLYAAGQSTVVNDQDLTQKLANMGKVDGTFGDGLTSIDQAKIILALEWTNGIFFREAAIDHLVTYRGEGGLMLDANGKENVASTAWALIVASQSSYAEAFAENLVVSLKTAISSQGYFCSEVEPGSCTTQALAIIALCFANENLASESYIGVLDAFNRFQMGGGAFTDSLDTPKADNTATNMAWLAANMVKQMYTKLENIRAEEEEQAPGQEDAPTTSQPAGESQREFPTTVVLIAGGCLVLIIISAVLGAVSKKQKQE